jgi:integrase/recombinase XerC
MQNQIASFVQYLQFEKRYSVHTVEAYQRDVIGFYTFYSDYSEEKSWSAVTHKDIRAWLSGLMDDSLEARSVNRKLSSLKSFFKYLTKIEIVKQNPAILASAPKIRKLLPKFVESQQMDNLLDQIEFDDSFIGKRDKLILSLFYHTGIRRAELINLTWTNVDLSALRIKVLGKRNKERIIPLQKELVNLLIDFRHESENVANESLPKQVFVTEKGKPMNPKTVYQIVHQYLSLVSTIEQRSPHVLRHSFATHMLNNGADLNAIKELLGHANLAATQVYTHNSFENLKKSYLSAHPRA